MDVAALVRRFEVALLRYVQHLLGDSSPEAEDIVQDTFLRLHRQCHAHGRDSIVHLQTWLFRVAHNLAMDALRRRGGRRRMQEKLQTNAREPDADDTLGDMERREVANYAMKQLEQLPGPQRRVLALKLLEGLTIRQIAKVIDTPPSTVGYQLNQGLTTLTRHMKQKGLI